MDGSCTRRATATITALLAGLGLQLRSQAAEPSGYVPRTTGPQFMLYLSRSLGMHGAGANRIGLRYENATSVSTDPAFRFCAPMRHHALIDFQLARGTSPRFLFGDKATWDIGRRQLGPTELATAAWPVWTMPQAGNARLASVP